MGAQASVALAPSALAPQDFLFKQTGSLGLTGEGVCVSAHRKLGLVAVATAAGDVCVFGRKGVFAALGGRPLEGHPLVHGLFFLRGQGKVAVVHDDGIRLVDLATLQISRELSSVAQLGHQVTCATPWLGMHDGRFMYLGASSGDVHVFDVARQRLCQYTIKRAQTLPALAASVETAPVALAVNPQGPGELLVVFSTGHIVLWDLATSKVVRAFKAVENPRCATWDPSGECFAIGLQAGAIILWRKKKEEPALSLFATPQLAAAEAKSSGNGEATRQPVLKIEWTEVRPDAVGGTGSSATASAAVLAEAKCGAIAVLGGEWSTEPPGVRVLRGDFFSDKGKLRPVQLALRADAHVTDFALAPLEQGGGATTAAAAAAAAAHSSSAPSPPPPPPLLPPQSPGPASPPSSSSGTPAAGADLPFEANVFAVAAGRQLLAAQPRFSAPLQMASLRGARCIRLYSAGVDDELSARLEEVLEFLESCGAESSSSAAPWPLSGGAFGVYKEEDMAAEPPAPAVLVVGHVRSAVSFWRLSPPACFEQLLHFDLTPFVAVRPPAALEPDEAERFLSVTAVEFCVPAHGAPTLVACLGSGETLVLRLDAPHLTAHSRAPSTASASGAAPVAPAAVATPASENKSMGAEPVKLMQQLRQADPVQAGGPTAVKSGAASAATSAASSQPSSQAQQQQQQQQHPPQKALEGSAYLLQRRSAPPPQSAAASPTPLARPASLGSPGPQNPPSQERKQQQQQQQQFTRTQSGSASPAPAAAGAAPPSQAAAPVGGSSTAPRATSSLSPPPPQAQGPASPPSASAERKGARAVPFVLASTVSHISAVRVLAVDATTMRAAIGDEGGAVSVVDLQHATALVFETLPNELRAMSASFCRLPIAADAFVTVAYFGLSNGEIWCYNASNGKRVVEYRLDSLSTRAAAAAAPAPAVARAALGSGGPSAMLSVRFMHLVNGLGHARPRITKPAGADTDSAATQGAPGPPRRSSSVAGGSGASAGAPLSEEARFEQCFCLVVCVGKHIHVVPVPQDLRAAKQQQLPSAKVVEHSSLIIAAYLVEKPLPLAAVAAVAPSKRAHSALAVVDASMRLHVYSLMDLRLLHSAGLPSDTALHMGAHGVQVAADGLTVCLRGSSEVSAFTLFQAHADSLPPRLWDAGADDAADLSAKAQKRTGLLGSFFGGGNVDIASLFDKAMFVTDERKERDAREELMGVPRDSPPPAQAAAAELSAADQAGRDTQGAMKKAVNRAAQNLAKARQIEDRSADMGDAATDFADLAKKLRNKQNKGWF